MLELDQYKLETLKEQKVHEGQFLSLQQEKVALEQRLTDVTDELTHHTRNITQLNNKIVELKAIQLSFHQKMEDKEREIAYIRKTSEKRIAEVKQSCSGKSQSIQS